MDGVAHQHRKAMFLSLMSEEKVILLSKIVEELWQEAIHRQHKTRSYVLYDQLQDVLGRAACRWAGVLIPESEFPAFRRELTALFDFAGAVGPKYWLSLLARQKSNRRMMQYIEDVRKNKHDVPTDCAAAVIADYRDLEGKRLHTKIAAVELLNVLRPIVAVSAYITLTAHALDAFPASREVIVTGEDADFHAYAQEVRRFYPFFPAIPARVQEPFVWEKYEFGPRTRLLLDIYGTNHDPRFWAAPNEFCPSRFRDQEIDPFGFIPQGGGDHASNHRCPGEWITIALIKMALCFLTRRVRYRVPQQDKTIDFQRLPALPKSRFAVADMRLS